MGEQETASAGGGNGGFEVHFKAGKDFARNLLKGLMPFLPWIAMGAGGGSFGAWFTSRHDKEIAVLQEGQARMQGELDAIYKIVSKGREYRHKEMPK